MTAGSRRLVQPRHAGIALLERAEATQCGAQRARRQFSTEEISEGFAAARGLALPPQLRRMVREQGRDLHAELGPDRDPPHGLAAAIKIA
jgi:hypothetical protein